MERDKLRERIERVKQWEIYDFGEMQGKRAIIEPILDCLGWDTSNPHEVRLEYSMPSGRRIDYALLKGKKPLVLVEAKKPAESLDKPDYASQILHYAFEKGVPFAVLSNGIDWWFYLPLEEGDWQTRKFYSIDLNTQDIDSVCDRFVEFLSKDNIISGKALESAKKIHKGRERTTKTRQTLPEAWKAIINETNEKLVELLIEETESLCGFKPDESLVKDFILGKVKLSEPAVKPVPVRQSRRIQQNSAKRNFQNKHPKNFTFLDKAYPINQWNEILIGVCKIMAERHQDRFEQVLLNFTGPKNKFFSRNKEELEQPVEIPSTGIYAMAKIGANAIVRRSQNVIERFGDNPEDLSVETA